MIDWMAAAALGLLLRAHAAGAQPTTPTPPVTTECWSNFTQLYFDVERLTPNSTKTYVICPNRTYNKNGDLPIVARANTHFKCGDDGSSRNNCVLYGGSDSVVINDVVWGEPVFGVTIQGLTFQSAVGRTFIGLDSGDVTFLDCIIKVRRHLTV